MRLTVDSHEVRNAIARLQRQYKDFSGVWRGILPDIVASVRGVVTGSGFAPLTAQTRARKQGRPFVQTGRFMSSLVFGGPYQAGTIKPLSFTWGPSIKYAYVLHYGRKPKAKARRGKVSTGSPMVARPWRGWTQAMENRAMGALYDRLREIPGMTVQ